MIYHRVVTSPASVYGVHGVGGFLILESQRSGRGGGGSGTGSDRSKRTRHAPVSPSVAVLIYLINCFSVLAASVVASTVLRGSLLLCAEHRSPACMQSWTAF